MTGTAVTAPSTSTTASAGVGEQRLNDGRTVTLRWAGPADVPAIARLFTDLSPESFRSRFHGGYAGPALALRLAGVDAGSGMACVVAESRDDPGHLAAEARYVPMGDGAAELGLTVADAYQGTGLGRLLLALLADRARESGVARLRAVVSLTNGAMLHLLEPYGWVLAEPTDLAVACIEIAPDGGRPGWPDGVTGRKVLVEQRGWFENAQVATLRAHGDSIRVCAGPHGAAGRGCPLLTAGRCALAEQADVIIDLVPDSEDHGARLLDAHRIRWPERLAPPPGT